jgi:hypothetical protein
MENITFSLYEIIQIVLMLVTCYACYKNGHEKGVNDTLDYFESEGIIEKEETA